MKGGNAGTIKAYFLRVPKMAGKAKQPQPPVFRQQNGVTFKGEYMTNGEYLLNCKRHGHEAWTKSTDEWRKNDDPSTMMDSGWLEDPMRAIYCPYPLIYRDWHRTGQLGAREGE
jgi:hypothetical protein